MLIEEESLDKSDTIVSDLLEHCHISVNTILNDLKYLSKDTRAIINYFIIVCNKIYEVCYFYNNMRAQDDIETLNLMVTYAIEELISVDKVNTLVQQLRVLNIADSANAKIQANIKSLSNTLLVKMQDLNLILVKRPNIIKSQDKKNTLEVVLMRFINNVCKFEQILSNIYDEINGGDAEKESSEILLVLREIIYEIINFIAKAQVNDFKISHDEYTEFSDYIEVKIATSGHKTSKRLNIGKEYIQDIDTVLHKIFIEIQELEYTEFEIMLDLNNKLFAMFKPLYKLFYIEIEYPQKEIVLFQEMISIINEIHAINFYFLNPNEDSTKELLLKKISDCRIALQKQMNEINNLKYMINLEQHDG